MQAITFRFAIDQRVRIAQPNTDSGAAVRLFTERSIGTIKALTVDRRSTYASVQFADYRVLVNESQLEAA